MTERLAVALDLVLAALAEGQPEPARPPAGAQERHTDGYRRSVVELRTLAPAPESGGGHRALDLGLVDAGDPVTGVEKAVGERSVVGQQQGPLDVDVEAPHGKEPGRRGHEIGHHGASLGIAAGGDVAGRLVEQDVLPGCRAADALAVDADVVDLEVGQGPGLTDDDAVDDDAALEKEAISPPA